MPKLLLRLLIAVFSLPMLLKAQPTLEGYTNHTVAGFHVLVQDLAMNTNANMTNTALHILEKDLVEITHFCISQEIKDSLMAVPIFLDWNTATGAAVYHPSAAWLVQNGYPAEKARCIEISNATNFVNWTAQNQPYMVLHELAHAYHHRVLNFNNAAITNAYNNAVNNNLYQNVSYHNGDQEFYNVAVTYGMNNEREFFAELTEAYFGYNDYFPFDRNDLMEYDVVAYAAVDGIWQGFSISNEIDFSSAAMSAAQDNASYQWLICSNGYIEVEGATSQTFVPAESGVYAVEVSIGECSVISYCNEFIVIGIDEFSMNDIARLYPNPSRGNFAIDFGTIASANTHIHIYDAFGRVVHSAFHCNRNFINVDTTLPSGIYLVKLSSDNQSQVLRLVIE